MGTIPTPWTSMYLLVCGTLKKSLHMCIVTQFYGVGTVMGLQLLLYVLHAFKIINLSFTLAQ